MTEEIVKLHDAGIHVCCGARMLAEFGNCNEWEGSLQDKKWSGKKGNALLKKELEFKVKTWQFQAFLIAILNADQWRNIGQIFLDVGFEVVASGSAHGSRLRLLSYTNHKQSVVKDNAKKPIGQPAVRRKRTSKLSI